MRIFLINCRARCTIDHNTMRETIIHSRSNEAFRMNNMSSHHHAITVRVEEKDVNRLCFVFHWIERQMMLLTVTYIGLALNHFIFFFCM